MPAAAAVADPLEFEFEVGGRWFSCVREVDPVVLLGVMRRTQRPPTDPTDPALQEWLAAVIGFVLLATHPADHDALVATITAQLGGDTDAAFAEVAEVFGGLLALFADRQVDDVRATVLEMERARTAEHPFPACQLPPIRRRSQVADIERVNRRHGNKATGEVLPAGE